MDVLSDELRELGSTAGRLLERFARTSPLPPPFGAPARFDRELWSSLAGLGLLGLAVPEELGGSGGGIGFTWEHPSHVYLKRARARRILLGSQTGQLDGLAQLILGR
jgi:alkylation response protein AidB-like acyl-CoA dehydrogenase